MGIHFKHQFYMGLKRFVGIDFAVEESDFLNKAEKISMKGHRYMDATFLFLMLTGAFFASWLQ